jgi:dienelactone hydrolase
MVRIYSYIEYTGYGINEEGFSPSEQYTYNDIECVYKYLTGQMNIQPDNIVLYGRSLGGGPSCYLAEKYKVGGY